MINKMIIVDKMLLDTIVTKVKTFLTEYTDIDYDSITAVQNNSNKLTLHNYATTVNISGKLSFIIMMSFEESIVKNIAKIFLDGDEVAENENREIYNSVAKEAINIIIGLALASFKNNGKGLNMTTPSIIDDTEIKKYENMPIFSEDLITKLGKLSISIINYNMESE